MVKRLFEVILNLTEILGEEGLNLPLDIVFELSAYFRVF